MSLMHPGRMFAALFVALLMTGLTGCATPSTVAKDEAKAETNIETNVETVAKAAAEVRGPILTWHGDPTTEVTVTWLELGNKALDIAGASAANQWWQGEAGFGYGDDDDATRVNLRGKHTTLYTRIAFDLDENSVGQPTQLHIRYDDGFIAYLNGQEIARASVTGTPGKDLKVSSHEAGNNFEAIDLPTWAKHARKGQNVLAIVGYNASTDSSDLTLDAYLKAADNEKPIVAKNAMWSFFFGDEPDAQWMTPGFTVPDAKPVAQTNPSIKLATPTMSSAVWWRKVGDTAWRKATGSHRPFADSGHTVHAVELSKLTPGTAYEFVPVAAGDAAGPVARTQPMRFRTAPDKLTSEFKFVTGGDMGVGDVAKQITAQAGKTDPAFALLGGDLAYANGKSTDRWLTWLDDWHKLARTTDGHLVPMVIVIGNHEMGSRLTEGQARQLQTHPRSKFFYSLFSFPDGKPTFAVDFGSYLSIYALDSDHSIKVADQTDWLAEALNARTNQTYQYVCYHKPTYGTAKAPNMNVRNEWVPLFEKHKVDAVFENDHHTYKRTHPILKDKVDEKNGILYLGDGAWGVGVRQVPKPGEQWFLNKAESRNHFWLVTLTDQAPRYQAIDKDGVVFDDYEDKRGWR